MLLKGGKIIPKLVYERIFTLEKKGKEEVEKKTRRKRNIVVLHVNSSEVEKKKKNEKGISQVYIIIFNIVIIRFAYSPTTPY